MAAKKRKTPDKKAAAKKAEAPKGAANVTEKGVRRRPGGMDPVEFRLRELERRVAELEA